MANDASKIRFAPNGGLFIAPAPTGGTGSTVLPDDVGDGGKTAPAGYKSFGYVDESGVTITPSIETDPVSAWQSAVPVLYNVKGASFQIKATLLETSKLTTEQFYGASWVEVMSDDVTPEPTGIYRLDLSSTPELSELSIVVDWAQKGKNYRTVVPRAMISDRGGITLQRTEAQKYELTIDALDYNGGLGYVLTDEVMTA
ncbi:phage tail tube protein [Streptomyces sp. NPDC002740]